MGTRQQEVVQVRQNVGVWAGGQVGGRANRQAGERAYPL